MEFMNMCFDIVDKTLYVIFVDDFCLTSIFRRTYEDRNQLDKDLDSFCEDDSLEVFRCLKKHPEWFVVLLQNQYMLKESLKKGNVF